MRQKRHYLHPTPCTLILIVRKYGTVEYGKGTLLVFLNQWYGSDIQIVSALLRSMFLSDVYFQVRCANIVLNIIYYSKVRERKCVNITFSRAHSNVSWITVNSDSFRLGIEMYSNGRNTLYRTPFVGVELILNTFVCCSQHCTAITSCAGVE